MPKLHFTIEVAAPLEKVFRAFTQLENIRHIQPGWVKPLWGNKLDRKGKHFILLFRQGFLPTLWWGYLSEFQNNHLFVDEQILKIFKKWKHTHRFKPTSKGTHLEDVIEYELWGGPVGRWLDRVYVRSLLQRMYSYRQKKVGEIFR